VGDSGIGNYHGKYSYETFTHQKSVVVRNFSKIGEAMNGVRYPPYSTRNAQIIAAFIKHLSKFNIRKGQPLAYLVSFAVGAATTMAFATKWLVTKKSKGM